MESNEAGEGSAHPETARPDVAVFLVSPAIQAEYLATAFRIGDSAQIDRALDAVQRARRLLREAGRG